MEVEEFAEHFPDARRQPNGWYSARCPAHDDRTASFGFAAGTEGIRFVCQAGCDKGEILKAVGLSMTDAFYTSDVVVPLKPAPVVARYEYRTTTGSPVMTVFRREDKSFFIKPGMPPLADRVLYRLPEMARAKAEGQAIYVCEGEKDADNLAARGFPAVCNPGGAGKWNAVYTSQLLGARNVFVLADDDAPGRRHAQDVVTALRSKEINATGYLPAEGFKDVSAMFEAGLGLDHLRCWEPGGEPAAEVDGLHLLRASDLEPKPVPWAWQSYLPIGTLVYFEGDPAASKSTVSIDLAARFTTGAEMPDGSANGFGGAVDVIMFAAEDDPEYTIVPRAMAAGADRTRLHIVRSASKVKGVSFDLSVHLERLRAAIIETGAKVVTIDPLAAYMGEKVDTGSDPSVRRALLPLFDLAAELGVLILIVRHLNKSHGSKAMCRSSGSVAFVGITRASFVITSHPEVEGQRVMTPLKTNLVPESSVPALAYRLDTVSLGPGITVARVVWEGATDVTAQEALDGSDEEGTRFEYRRMLLAAVEDGPKSFKEIAVAARKAGFSSEKRIRYHMKSMLRKGYAPGEGNRGTLYVAPDATFPWEEATSTPHVDTIDLPLYPDAHSAVTQDPEVAEYERETELQQRERICDVCGRPGAVPFMKPWWVIRCGTHNPITWRKE